MPTPTASNQQTLRVYDVRLVPARRPLKLAEGSLDNADAAARVLHALIGLTDREHFAILFLNGSTRITGAHIAAVGAQHMIGALDPRAIFRAALAACASAIVLGHNHPSGNPLPSAEDVESTAHLMRAGALLGVQVVDHVIVTPIPGRDYSMFEQGTLPSVT